MRDQNQKSAIFEPQRLLELFAIVFVVNPYSVANL